MENNNKNKKKNLIRITTQPIDAQIIIGELISSAGDYDQSYKFANQLFHLFRRLDETRAPELFALLHVQQNQEMLSDTLFLKVKPWIETLFPKKLYVYAQYELVSFPDFPVGTRVDGVFKEGKYHPYITEYCLQIPRFCLEDPAHFVEIIWLLGYIPEYHFVDLWYPHIDPPDEKYILYVQKILMRLESLGGVKALHKIRLADWICEFETRNYPLFPMFAHNIYTTLPPIQAITALHNLKNLARKLYSLTPSQHHYIYYIILVDDYIRDLLTQTHFPIPLAKNWYVFVNSQHFAGLIDCLHLGCENISKDELRAIIFQIFETNAFVKTKTKVKRGFAQYIRALFYTFCSVVVQDFKSNSKVRNRVLTLLEETFNLLERKTFSTLNPDAYKSLTPSNLSVNRDDPRYQIYLWLQEIFKNYDIQS